MSFLKFIKWSDLENWSANYYFLEKQKNIKFSEVKVSSFLTRVKKEILIKDNILYKRVTIKIKNKGVYLRDELLGKNIGTKKQYIINKGQFIISKIDARNGAFGIVPNELDNAIVTASFLNYDINEKIINPIYLTLFVTTNYFMEICENNSSGTTGRRNISEELFLNSFIPLPPIDIQEKIVDEYQKRILEIENLKKQNEIIEQNSKNYLLQELGIDNLNSQSEFNKTDKILHFKKYSEIKDWSVENEGEKSYKSKFDLVKLDDICDTNIGLTYSPNDILYDKNSIPVLRSNNIKDNKISYDDLVMVKKQPRKNQMVNIGDLLMCVRNGSKNLVGKVALIEKNNMSFGAFMAIIRSKYNQFLYYFLKSDYFRNTVSFAKSTGINQISQSDIKNFQIPLPPLDIQKQIVKHLDEMQKEIDDNKAKILNLEFLAKDEFEKAVFG